MRFVKRFFYIGKILRQIDNRAGWQVGERPRASASRGSGPAPAAAAGEAWRCSLGAGAGFGGWAPAVAAGGAWRPGRALFDGTPLDTIQRMTRTYFDWAATTPPFPELYNILAQAPFGNPSSRHREGREARQALEDARRRCAQVLGVKPEQLIFTSGGTESNALALQSLLVRHSTAGLLYGATEHPSVRENAEQLQRLYIPVASIPAERDGRIGIEAVLKTMEKARERNLPVRMLAIMAVNNETGAITDIETIVQTVRQLPGPALHIHTDLVQTIGKVPFSLAGSGIDSAAISAHKLGGPRGIGLLYLKRPLIPLTRGGEQEWGFRPGTENVAGALAMAYCLEQLATPDKLVKHYEAAQQRMAQLISGLKKSGNCMLIPEDRQEQDPRFSPYILQAAFPGIPGEVMVRALDDAGIAISTGSACSSGKIERPVLKAMGIDADTSFCSVRFSQGWATTEQDIETLLHAVSTIRKTL
ncbi:Cysteine desulfurase [Gracilinema caldarium DSM 7334]|uniref:Cysteine desulfurase n=2 Tax=Gracilinema caldarium TaxID=215591 RepID=F8F2S0_GRAC1|nr:Cysteine desulfurase [Gracilinema caldarium DSM 7334]